MLKNKILLMSFRPSADSSYSEGCLYPSTAVMLIGSVLKKHGFAVQIIDAGYRADYLDTFKKVLKEQGEEILYVGMSVMVTQIPLALEASKLVKTLSPAIPVVWGGVHPTLFPEQTLKNECVDIVAVNEGTVAALHIAECLKNGEDLSRVKGIGYKDKNNGPTLTGPSDPENIEDLPYFDFSLLKLDDYLKPKGVSVYKREFPRFKGDFKMMPILTALGCPFRCQFCINVILGRSYRLRSAASIINEIKRLQSEYGANTFLFYDEDFFVNRKRTLEFVELAEKESLHFNFRTWCRVDHFRENYMNPELLRRLAAIGYGSLAMGGESASIEILRELKKGITPEQTINSLRTLTAHSSIFPRYSFMVGLENETFEQIGKTFKFCLQMKRINPGVDIAGPFVFRLYPGSPIYDRMVKKYNLRPPESLEQWAEEISNYGSAHTMPWAPKRFLELQKYILFYANYAFLNYESPDGPVKNLMRFLLVKAGEWRIKYFFFGFPIEYKAYKFFKNMLKMLKRNAAGNKS